MTIPPVSGQELYVEGDGKLTYAGQILLQEMRKEIIALIAGEYDMRIAQAEREILNTYGDTVSVAEKKKSLMKFGKHTALGTTLATVWETGGLHGDANETYVTTNAIDSIVSSNAGDTEELYIEGHTVSGTGSDAQFTFVTQTATLSGQTEVTLGTPLARVSRAYVTSSAALSGDVSVYESTALSGGVPVDTTKIHLSIAGSNGETQSFKAATTFSNTDYFICTGGYAGITKKTSASADFVMEVRKVGGVFRPVTGRISLSTSGTTTAQIKFDPYAIVPKNADIRVRAVASTTAVEVDATFTGYMAVVI